MNNKEIINILTQWNFWGNDLSVGFSRPKYVESLYRQKDIKEISVITGVRRSGKSTAVLQTLKKIIADGAPPVNTLCINLEDPAFAGELNLKFLLQIYDAYIEKFAPTGKIYVVLDEANMVPMWEKFVRGLYDRNVNVKFYVTGSSAYLISREYGRTLTGRIRSNIIFPLSFKEFLEFKNQASLLARSRFAPELRHYFQEYLRFGGFPQPSLTNFESERTRILKDYYSAIIEKDIAERYGIRNISQLKEFCFFVMSNNAALVSGYAAEKKQDISQPTANKFLHYLEEVFLLLSLEFFSYSVVRRQSRPKKIYSIDTGLYNAVSFKFSENIGRVFENAVFLSLKRTDQEVFYWQGKREVDFIVRQGLDITRLINVCWDLTEKTKKREVDGLVEAMREFKLKTAEIISIGQSETIETVVGAIQVKNFLEMDDMIQ